MDDRGHPTLMRDPEDQGLMRMGLRPSLRDYITSLWERREFIWTVPLGQLRAQNQNTVLGNLWHLLNPLLLAAVFYFIFGVLFGGEGTVDNFVGFLVIGLFTYYYTQKATLGGARTVISNLALIRNINMPRASLPIAAVVAETLAHGPAIVTMLFIAVLTGERPHLVWLAVIPITVVQGMFNLGLAFITARMTFHFRDVQQALPYLLRLWLYLSGIFFTVERVPEGIARTIFQLNPMHAFITLSRAAVLDDTTVWVQWRIATLWAAGAFVVGLVYFWRAEDRYGRE